MTLENPLTFVRSLKGAPASILWAFFFTRRAMTALELQQWTGYAGDNITVALRLLVELGWLSARSPRGPWCLADGRQFPLMQDESDLIGFVPSVVGVDESKSFFPTITTITTTKERPNPIKSESGVLDDFGSRSQAEHDDLIRALNEHGIIGKKRQALLMCEWVDGDYVRGHVAHAISERLWDQPVGMAITRMLEQVPVPAAESNYRQVPTQVRYVCDGCGTHPCSCDEHDSDCMCVGCKRAHPERFCTALVTGADHLRHVCDQFVEAGHAFCAEHESEEQ